MFDYLNTTKQSPLASKRDFVYLKELILGKKYHLSLVFVTDSEAKKLNKKYRNKEYVPNILSFPYSKTEGEIFINIKKIKKEAPDFNMSNKTYMHFIFIHGCLHLKGYGHGKKMEDLEKKYIKKI